MMKNKLFSVMVGAASLALFAVVPVAASPEVPNPPANENGSNNGAGIGCDMGKFHSELARDGNIGKNKSHYPGQHKGASVCKAG